MIEKQLNVFALAFIGVVFALFLTVFSTAATVCDFRLRPHVPFVRTAVLLHGSERDLEITILRNREVFVGRMLVPTPQLQTQLVGILEQTGERSVVVSADGSVPFDVVRQVLQATRDAGFTEVSLVTFRGTILGAYERGARL
jgi:biopolymer transport protein ExbD